MLTFLAGLLAFGTIWFWLLSVIVFIAITALVENDEGVWATVVMIGTVLSLNYFSKIPILDSIKANPLRATELVLSYFVLGAGWSLVKWFFFLHKERIKYEEYKANFLKNAGKTLLTPELAAKLVGKLLSGHGSERINVAPPNAHEHKGALTRWATYWPFSIVGTLLNDVVRKAWTYIYELLQSTYQRMSNYVFRGVSADMKMAQDYTYTAGLGDTRGGRSAK